MTTAAPAVQPEGAPLALQAARELEEARQGVLGTGGGRAVLRGVHLCAVHGVPMPQWLRDEYIRRHDLVTGARVMGWNEAFDRYWAKGTRLSTERKRQVMTARVYARAWALLRSDPSRSIGRDLFEEVGEARDINMSGSAAEKLYYRAVDGGALSLVMWRKSELAARAESLAIRDK